MNPVMLSRALALALPFLAWTACRPAPPGTSLPEAAQKGQMRLVQQHIEARSDLNVRDKVGMTAAHHAAMRGDLPMVRALASAGATLTLPNAIGKTALDLARANGRTQVAQFLQERPEPRGGGRGLVDGGLGVSSVLDSP